MTTHPAIADYVQQEDTEALEAISDITVEVCVSFLPVKSSLKSNVSC